MKIEIGLRGDPAVTGIVTDMIESAKLPLYEQAAQNTGFGLSVSAREGQSYTFWHTGNEDTNIKGWMRTVIVPEGRIGITITRPAEQKNHAAFWKAFRELQAEQNPPK